MICCLLKTDQKIFDNAKQKAYWLVLLQIEATREIKKNELLFKS